MLFDIVIGVAPILLGIGLGILVGEILRRWEIENKEPNPKLVRDRKELISIFFVLVCLVILYTGVLRSDRSGGMAVLSVLFVPAIFLCIELTQTRYEDGPRGSNALWYFIFNIVFYGLVRVLNLFPVAFQSMNNISSSMFVISALSMFVIDVFFTLITILLANDTDAEDDLKRAYPVYIRGYVIMLAVIGLLLIIRV